MSTDRHRELLRLYRVWICDLSRPLAFYVLTSTWDSYGHSTSYVSAEALQTSVTERRVPGWTMKAPADVLEVA